MMNTNKETKPVPPERKKRQKRPVRKPLVVKEMTTDGESMLEQQERGGDIESHAIRKEKLHQDTTVELANDEMDKLTLKEATSSLDKEVSQTADTPSTEEIRVGKEKDADSKQFINHPKANLEGDASNKTTPGDINHPKANLEGDASKEMTPGETDPGISHDATSTNNHSIEKQEEDKINIITQIAISPSDKKGDEKLSKRLKLDLGDDIKDNQIQSVKSDFIKQRKKSPETQKTDNGEEQYPESLNPFAESASDTEYDQQCIDSSDTGDMRVSDGPIRKTVKQRSSLYPWRPFAGGPREYKFHMIPARQSMKTRASLYPWRPCGEEEYPEELNPFSEKEIADDGKLIQQFKLCEKEDTKPQKQTRAGDSVAEDETQDSEKETTELPVAKKMGRGKKFLKVVKKKTERFWCCLLRR